MQYEVIELRKRTELIRKLARYVHHRKKRTFIFALDLLVGFPVVNFILNHFISLIFNLDIDSLHTTYLHF